MRATASMLAHAKWVVTDPSSFVTDWRSFFGAASLLATAGAVAVAWWKGAERLLGPRVHLLRAFGRLSPFVPRVLGAVLGAPLVVLALGDRFLSPGTPLDGSAGGRLLAVAEAVVGAWFVVGRGRRAAAAAFFALGLAGIPVAGVVATLEAAHLFGVASCLALLPAAARRCEPVPTEHLRRPLLAVRVGVGVALVVVAFSEKLANPTLGLAVVRGHPELNVFRLVGLDVSDAAFVRLAGAVEVFFALAVVSGVVPRVVALVVAGPFFATLAMFGTVELLGHLPFYGALLALLAYGSPAPATVTPSAAARARRGASEGSAQPVRKYERSTVASRPYDRTPEPARR